jgi:uncharacterized protein with NRDE domain
MCLLLIALEQHPLYKLVLAANRDEYYDRPTAPAQFWEDRPDLLAGHDLKAGGTWLGITRAGRLAAITNYRDPAQTREHAPSRGNLVLDFLEKKVLATQYLDDIRKEGDQYNGFNLVLGTIDELFWYSNRGNGIRRLSKGIYGLSNHLLDTPWPKVEKAKKGLSSVLTSEERVQPEDLFGILGDRARPANDVLPDTGVGLEWERILSPMFISSPVYGTRSSTIILVDRRDRVLFTERTYNSQPDQFQDVTYRFHRSISL